MADDMTADGTVRITQAEIYRELQGVKQVQSETNALLQQHIALQEQQNASISATVNDLIAKRASDRSDIDRHELDITILKTAEAGRTARKAPWWSWIAGVGGSIAGLSGLIGLWLLLDKMAAAYSTYLP